MEIFHAFGIDWKLLTIQGVNFLIVLWIIRRYAWGPIMSILEKREKTIAEGVHAAEESKRERAAIESERSEVIASARQEGGKIVDELRKQAVEAEREILRSAQEKSRDILSDAERKAEDEREYMKRESEKDVAKMAVLAAEKILRSNS